MFAFRAYALWLNADADVADHLCMVIVVVVVVVVAAAAAVVFAMQPEPLTSDA